MSLGGVVIVEDHPISRIGIADQLAGAGFDVVSTGTHVEDPELRFEQAAAVVSDLHFDGRSRDRLLQNQRAIAHLVRSCPNVLAVSSVVKAQVLLEVVAGGASGYVAKTADPSVIVEAVRTVIDGGKFVSPELAVALLNDADARRLPAGDIGAFERQILHAFAQGDSAGEVGRSLGVEPRRVAAIVDSIWNLEARRRSHPEYRLTTREQELCVAARRGMSHDSIAAALRITRLTVSDYLKHVKAKWDRTHGAASAVAPMEAARRFAEEMELELVVTVTGGVA